MLLLLADKLPHDLISGEHCSALTVANKSILQALEWRLSLAGSFLRDQDFLSIVVINFFHAHLVFFLPIGQFALRLERLDLSNGQVAVLIDLVNSFDHPGEVAPLDTEIFLELNVDLFEDNTLPPQFVNLLSQCLVLCHGCVIALVGLVKTILGHLDLLRKMTRSIGARTCRATHRRALPTLLLYDLTLQVLDLVIDALASGNLTLDLVDQFLNLLLLQVYSFLRHTLLFLLLRMLRLLHLNLFKQLIVLDLYLTHLLLLLLELALQVDIK